MKTIQFDQILPIVPVVPEFPVVPVYPMLVVHLYLATHSFLLLNRALERPPEAGRLVIEGFGLAKD